MSEENLRYGTRKIITAALLGVVIAGSGVSQVSAKEMSLYDEYRLAEKQKEEALDNINVVSCICL